MKIENSYHIIFENDDRKYLKTKVSWLVIECMLEKYVEFYHMKKDKDDWSFQKFLLMHGIECVYDGTFGYFNVDDKIKEADPAKPKQDD